MEEFKIRKGVVLRPRKTEEFDRNNELDKLLGKLRKYKRSDRIKPGFKEIERVEAICSGREGIPPAQLKEALIVLDQLSMKLDDGQAAIKAIANIITFCIRN